MLMIWAKNSKANHPNDVK